MEHYDKKAEPLNTSICACENAAAIRKQTARHEQRWGSECRRQGHRAVWLCIYMNAVFAFEPQHQASHREKQEVGASTELIGLWPPCQHDLFSTSGPPSLDAFLFPSLPLASSPNPHLFLSASIFLSSKRVCPYSRDISSPCDEALLLTVGTPGKMVNRHTSFCRQAPQLHSGPEDTSQSDLPLILILYREDQWVCNDPGVTLPVP